MLKRILFFLLLASAAPICRASDAIAVKIEQVGLEGVYKQNSGAVWIKASLRNTTPQPLSFSAFIAEVSLDAGSLPMTETFLLPMTLAPSEERVVDVPLPIYFAPHAVIYVEARDARGWPLGRTGRRVLQGTDGQIIGMICSTPELCSNIRKTILLSGSPDEQTHKSQALRLAQLLNPPSDDWAYSGAYMVILAAPVARFSERQREALHLFLLQGGKVVLVDDQLGDATPGTRQNGAGKTLSGPSAVPFLGEYRSRYPAGSARTVGNGQLVHFASASSPPFSDFLRPLGFSESTPEEVRRRLANRIFSGANPAEEVEARWLIRRLGTSFRFPSFTEVLVWMIGYIVAVGLVNFVILRRIGRPEWGWISIPLLAILASLLVYVSSERHRPRNFGIDEMTVYRMDDLSPVATAMARIRVSAPSRSMVAPQLPPEWTRVIPARRAAFDNFAMLDPGSGPAQAIQEIHIGKFWEAEFPLRRWSFADLDFQSCHLFAGRIYRDPAGRFHNESGISYGQAIVVDHEDVFLLGYFPAGAVVDLAHVQRRPYASESGRNVSVPFGYPGEPFLAPSTQEDEHNTISQDDADREWNQLGNSPFSLLEMIRGWSRNGDHVFSDTKAVFFGLTGQAPVGATLRDRSPDRKSASLVVVTFGEWP
jgi:hypothetical protein